MLENVYLSQIFSYKGICKKKGKIIFYLENEGHTGLNLDNSYFETPHDPCLVLPGLLYRDGDDCIVL